MRLKFKIGDRVRLKKGVSDEREEAKHGCVYIVREVHWSINFGHFVQLNGLHSSYSFQSLELVE